MSLVSDIKLIRTDTTLDLSQKAEKGMSWLSHPPPLYIAPNPRVPPFHMGLISPSLPGFSLCLPAAVSVFHLRFGKAPCFLTSLVAAFAAGRWKLRQLQKPPERDAWIRLNDQKGPHRLPVFGHPWGSSETRPAQVNAGGTCHTLCCCRMCRKKTPVSSFAVARTLHSDSWSHRSAPRLQ